MSKRLVSARSESFEVSHPDACMITRDQDPALVLWYSIMLGWPDVTDVVCLMTGLHIINDLEHLPVCVRPIGFIVRLREFSCLHRRLMLLII